MSEDSGILISNTPIIHDDVVPRVDADVGVQTISDGALNPSPVLWVSAYSQKATVCADAWHIMLATLLASKIIHLMHKKTILVYNSEADIRGGSSDDWEVGLELSQFPGIIDRIAAFGLTSC